MKAALLSLPALAAFAPHPVQGQEAIPARIQLPNGLTALLWEEHDAALILLEGLLPIQPNEVPAHLPGLPALLFGVLDASPKGNRGAAEFQSLLDRSGIRMGLALDPRGLKVTMACRSRDQELAFGLLGDLLGRSPLDPEAMEPQRMRLFRRPKTGPEEARERFLARASNSVLLPPPESTLAKASLSDLETLLTRIRRPGRLRLHIQGDLSPAQASQRLLLDLGAWSPAGVDAPLEPSPVPADTKVEHEGPGELLMAFPPPPPEEAASALLDILLTPRLEGRGEPGNPWRLQATGGTPQAAQAALQARLAALTFTEADFAAAKALWMGRQRLLPLDPHGALRAHLRGLPSTAAVASLTRLELESALKALQAGAHRLWLGDAAWIKAVP